MSTCGTRNTAPNGLQISTEVVEAACKSVVGKLLKRSGLKWTKDGAEAVMTLLCCILSGSYEYFWAWSSEALLTAAA